MREAVLLRMKERQWTAYRLAKAVESDVPAQTVYNYVKGRTDMVGKSLSAVLEALDLVEKPCMPKVTSEKTLKKQA